MCIHRAPLNNIARDCSNIINNSLCQFVSDTQQKTADERRLEFISAQLRILYRGMETVPARARAFHFRSRYSFYSVDVIRLIPLSGGIEVRVEANNVTAAAFLHRVHIALGMTTRGCETTAPDTFPSRRRLGINRCSRKKEPGKGGVKRGSSCLPR